MRRRVGRPGLMGTVVRTAAVAGTATAVSGGMRRRQDEKAAQRQDAQAGQAAAQAPQPPASDEDRMQQIKELGQMRDSGLLTDEEFTREKERILST